MLKALKQFLRGLLVLAAIIITANLIYYIGVLIATYAILKTIALGLLAVLFIYILGAKFDE